MKRKEVFIWKDLTKAWIICQDDRREATTSTYVTFTMWFSYLRLLYLSFPFPLLFWNSSKCKNLILFCFCRSLSQRSPGTPQCRRRPVLRLAGGPFRNSQSREEELPAPCHLLGPPRDGGHQVKDPLPTKTQSGQATLAQWHFSSSG